MMAYAYAGMVCTVYPPSRTTGRVCGGISGGQLKACLGGGGAGEIRKGTYRGRRIQDGAGRQTGDVRPDRIANESLCSRSLRRT
jgi:hypothetical protein